MVVPIIPLLIGGGIAAKYAGQFYSGHYQRKSLYNQKEMYDAQISQYEKAKAQYQKNVGRPIKQPFDFDYNISQLQKQKQNVNYAIKANWGSTLSGAGSAASSFGAYAGKIGAYDGNQMYQSSKKALYNIGKGKKWL